MLNRLFRATPKKNVKVVVDEFGDRHTLPFYTNHDSIARELGKFGKLEYEKYRDRYVLVINPAKHSQSYIEHLMMGLNGHTVGAAKQIIEAGLKG